jgi:hypothetical protein
MLKTSDTTPELALGPSWSQTEKKYVIAKAADGPDYAKH